MEESKGFFDTNSLGWPAADVKRAKEMIDDMKAMVETKKFRTGVLDSLATGEVTLATTHPDYPEKLKEAKNKFAKPWTKTGGGTTAVMMQLYENKPRPLAMEKSKTSQNGGPATNAEQLTRFVLDTLVKMKAGDRLPDGDEAERATIPVRCTGHAFNLKPGNSSIATALKLGTKPDDFIADFKDVEGKKNAKRRNTRMPVTDPPTGLVAEMVKGTVSLFKAETHDAKIAVVNARIKALNAESISVPDLRALLKTAARDFMDADYATMAAAKREEWAVIGADRGASPALVLTGIIPKEEYGPLIDAAMRKMGMEGETQEKVKKRVLAALKGKDAVVKEDLAKQVRIVLRDLGFGGSDDDTKKAREAYEKLAGDPERTTALKAAGKTVTGPAATFDALKEDERNALVEHGVAGRLDAKLGASLIEPRGILFADPNWGDGDHMSQFTMVVNPLTDPGEIEMWQMNEDGSGAKKMDQSQVGQRSRVGNVLRSRGVRRDDEHPHGCGGRRRRQAMGSVSRRAERTSEYVRSEEEGRYRQDEDDARLCRSGVFPAQLRGGRQGAQQAGRRAGHRGEGGDGRRQGGEEPERPEVEREVGGRARGKSRRGSDRRPDSRSGDESSHRGRPAEVPR